MSFISFRMSSLTLLYKDGMALWEMYVFFGNSYCLSKVCSIFLNDGFSTLFNGYISLAI